MSAANYTDVATLADELGLDANKTTLYTNRLQRAIDDASRLIDRILGREAGEFAAQTETRYYDVSPPPYPEQHERDVETAIFTDEQKGTLTRLQIDALQSLTALAVDNTGNGVFDTTWTLGTDFLLYPLNLPTKREVVINPVTGRYAFPIGLKRVQIVGSWAEGAAIPNPIRRATLLQAARYYARGNSPLGVIGDGQVGTIKLSQGRLDPDAELILREAGYWQESFVLV